jgi:ubiquinone/menaquinone biosynthesis C-methylase UbiE
MSWETFLEDRAHHNLYVSSLVHKPVIKLIRRIASPGERLLEAGCGSGRTAMLFSDMGYCTVALDLSHNLLERISSARKFLPEMYPVNADIGVLPFKGKVFKASYSFGVLEHFDPSDIVNFLIEQRRVAKYVLVDIPNDRCENQCYGNERFYSDLQWAEFINRAGLKVMLSFHRGLDTGKYVGNCSVFLAADNGDEDILQEKIDVYDYY